ncbi:MAG: DUF2066 domain-containing protein [Woeseia sp.]|nr:DUF2066 domain-containing protein [Woeseia sp.]
MQRILRLGSACARQFVAVMFVGSLALVTESVVAVEVTDLYSAEVAIDPEDQDSRDTAYERALQQVLVRITGSEAAAYSPELRALFPNPARYVLQYRPAGNNALWVALDGAAIEQVLRQRGMPVWSSERPLTMVWLAVDWGRGQRELITAEPAENTTPRVDPRAAASTSIREQAQRVATARGLPVMFPDPEYVARLDVSLSDVWGGFHDELLSAARDLGASSVLVGRARPGDAARSRWSYYSGSQRQQWNGDVEDALHLLADNLAGEFVISGNEPLEFVDLTIRNVRSASSYVAVQKMIDDLQVIDQYRIRSANGDEIRYAVRINGGANRLASALDFNGQLVPVAAELAEGQSPDGSSLYYAYRP